MIFQNKKHKLAYIIGAFLGDGGAYISTKNHSMYQFTITTSDLDICENCQKIIQDIFGKQYPIKTVFNKTTNAISYYQLRACSKKICLFFNKITRNRTQIPRIKDHKSISFLCSGLMDTDGGISKINASDGYFRYRINFKNTEKKIVDGLISSLKMLKIETGKIQHKENYSRIYKNKRNKDSYSFSVNVKQYYKNLFFLCKRKQGILQEYNEKINVNKKGIVSTS